MLQKSDRTWQYLLLHRANLQKGNSFVPEQVAGFSFLQDCRRFRAFRWLDSFAG